MNCMLHFNLMLTKFLFDKMINGDFLNIMVSVSSLVKFEQSFYTEN